MGRKSKEQLARERGKLLMNKKTSTVDLKCKDCGIWMYDLPGDVEIVTCGRCVQNMIDPPEERTTTPTVKRPKGWHFRKEFVDSEGTVFHKGIEQPELKGKKKPTKSKKPSTEKRVKKE